MGELEQALYQQLDSLLIDYRVYRHRAVYTIEDTLDAGVKEAIKENVPHCKNLLLIPRHDRRPHLLLINETKRAPLRPLCDALGCGKYSFATPEELMDTLGLIPGSVTPFGLIHRHARDVIVLLDSDVLAQEKVCFHPCTNEASLVMSTAHLLRFLRHMGNELLVVPCPR